MISEILEAPKEFSYDDQEAMSDELIHQLAEIPKMTYDKAYCVLKAHRDLYSEALSHLNHNAAMQLREDPIVFVLDT